MKWESLVRNLREYRSVNLLETGDLPGRAIQVWKRTEEKPMGQGELGNRRIGRGYTSYFWYD